MPQPQWLRKIIMSAWNTIEVDVSNGCVMLSTKIDSSWNGSEWLLNATVNNYDESQYECWARQTKYSVRTELAALRRAIGGGGGSRRLVRAEILLRAGVLGDSLGALADGVLGQLTRQQQTHCRLDLPTGDGRALVVVSQTRRLGGDALEDVVDEAVHDAHRLRRDTSVGVDLLQHLVDVDGIGFLALALRLLVGLGDVLLGFAGLLGCLSTSFRRHFRLLADAIDDEYEQNCLSQCRIRVHLMHKSISELTPPRLRCNRVRRIA